jgi:hypothetical protein
MVERNADVSEDKRITFRVGVNLAISSLMLTTSTATA